MNSSLSSITLNDGNEILAGLISRERADSMISMGDRDVTFPTLENQNEITPLQRLEELENENRNLREQLKLLSQNRLSSAVPDPSVVAPLEILHTSKIMPQSRHPFAVILNQFVEEVNGIVSSLNSSTITLPMYSPMAADETKEGENKKMSAEDAPEQLLQSIAFEVLLVLLWHVSHE